MAEQLQELAASLVARGKGILAADETVPTLTRRFDALHIPSTERTRRDYREMLFTFPGAAEFISGVILQDETIRQKSAAGVPLAEVLSRQGIMPGIKVDTGARPLAGCPGETVTEGLDGLRERLAEYRDLGARFAKWRAVIRIGDGMPSAACVSANAHALARYAALCQEQGLVPIVEPEVLMDGAHDHRTLRTGNGLCPARRLQCAGGAARHVGGHAAEAEHGHGRSAVFRRCLGAGRGDGDVAVPAPACSGRGAWDCVSFGRSGGETGDQPFGCHQPAADSETVDDQFFVWACSAGSGAESVAWKR